MKYLETKVPEQSRELKQQQIVAGIKGAHTELVKMSTDLFSDPKIFLLLLDPKRGAPFCCVLVSVLCDLGVQLDGEWRAYNEQNKQERVFKEVLANCDNVDQHFGLMGFLRPELPEVRNEVQQLS